MEEKNFFTKHIIYFYKTKAKTLIFYVFVSDINDIITKIA
jgi:hypothetical protein